MLMMAAVAIVTMTSCSDDSNSNTDNNNPSGTVLLKKTIETFDDGTTETVTYTYNGTKLMGTTSSEGNREELTYTGDNITRWKYYSPENVLTEDYTFTYENGKLSQVYSVLDLDANGTTNNITTTYTYLADGSQRVMRSDSDPDYPTEMIRYQDKIKIIHNSPMGQSIVWYYFEFDNKKNPYNNITGYDKAVTGLEYRQIKFDANVTRNYSMIVDGVVNQELYSSVFTYNAQDYPFTEVQTYLGEVSNVQYFYE